jgi:hypothetical protein
MPCRLFLADNTKQIVAEAEDQNPDPRLNHAGRRNIADVFVAQRNQWWRGSRAMA